MRKQQTEITPFDIDDYSTRRGDGIGSRPGSSQSALPNWWIDPEPADWVATDPRT